MRDLETSEKGYDVVSVNSETLLEPTLASPSRQGHAFWLKKSFLAIFEQALIAGSNFLLNVLVARWLTADQYGAYAIAFSVYMLLIGVYQGVILEPMAVLASSLDEERFRSYLGSLLRVQLWISLALVLCLSLVVGGIFATRHQHYLAWTLVALIPSLPAILCFWMLRNACYVRRSPQFATQSAFVYSLIMLAGLILVRQWMPITGFLVFIGMGLSATAVSCFLLTRLRPNFRSSLSDREQWTEHWNFGRWELSKITFDWMYQNISYTLTAGFLLVAQVGAIKAIMTLFLPITQCTAALRRLILPYLATAFEEDGPASIRISVRNISILYFAAGLAYGLFVSVFAKPLFVLLYGGKFVEYSKYVPWVAVAILFGMPGNVFDMGLRAIRSPKSLFVASCISSIACITITVPLTWRYSIQGAAISIVISSLVLFITIIVLFRRRTAAAAEKEIVPLTFQRNEV